MHIFFRSFFLDFLFYNDNVHVYVKKDYLFALFLHVLSLAFLK